MKCSLCGDSTESFIVKNKRLEKKYYRCKNCSFIFLDEKELLSPLEELERYKMHNNSIEDPHYREYFEKFISYAFEGIEKGGGILDYGSGPEPVLEGILKEKGYDVDIYDKYFSNEKNYRGKKYDVICSTEVFEHIYHPLKVLEELVSHIEEEGHLILMTNFHGDSWEKFRLWWYIQDPTHVVFYNMKTFQWIANRLGLKVLKSNGKNIVVFQKKDE